MRLTYSSFSELLETMKKVEYGRMEGVLIDIPDDDEDLLWAANIASDVKKPVRKIAHFIKGKHALLFDVLKFQDGLPMYGEITIKNGLIRTVKFT